MDEIFPWASSASLQTAAGMQGWVDVMQEFIFDVCSHSTCSTWFEMWDEQNQSQTKVWGHWGFHCDLEEVCLCATANFQTWCHKVKCSFVTSDRKECPAVVRGEYLRSRPGQRGSSRWGSPASLLQGVSHTHSSISIGTNEWLSEWCQQSGIVEVFPCDFTPWHTSHVCHICCSFLWVQLLCGILFLLLF